MRMKDSFLLVDPPGWIEHPPTPGGGCDLDPAQSS